MAIFYALPSSTMFARAIAFAYGLWREMDVKKTHRLRREHRKAIRRYVLIIVTLIAVAVTVGLFIS